MKCEDCQGRGFTELEHGLIQVECSKCKGTGEVEEPALVPDLTSITTKEEADKVASEMLDQICPPDKKIDGKPDVLILSGEMCREGETIEELADKARRLINARIGEVDDSSSRTGRVDKPARSRDTGKSKRTKKRKATK